MRKVTSTKAGPSTPALHAVELAEVPSVTYGPYLGLGDNGALVVWASLEGSERKFKAASLSARGRPQGPVTTVSTAPQQIGVVAVRSFGSGFGIVYTRQGQGNESLEALCVNARGAPEAPASVITTLPGPALWVEALAVEGGALTFYAVRGKERGTAEVWAVPLDQQCKAGERVQLSKDALAWQAARLGRGAALALVHGPRAAGGSVSAAVLDPSGKVRQFTEVTTEPGAELDLDAAPIGERLLMAWTDRRSLEPRILTAVLDVSGKLVAPPERLTPSEGEQALVRLIPPSKAASTAFVAWERLLSRPSGGRVITVSAIGADGRLSGGRTEIEYASSDGGVPEFAATLDGLAVLTLASACERGRNCNASDLAPIYLRLDRQLKPLDTEPLRLEPLQGGRAELGFGLGCSGEGCFAISALNRVPAPIFATELEHRSNVWRPPITTAPSSTTPRLIEHEAITRAKSVAAFSLSTIGTTEYLGYVTEFDPTTPRRRMSKPAPDGRFEPLSAEVVLERLLPASVRPAQAVPASPISLRARSLGGIALCPGDPKKEELLVAWAGLDQGVPQLFLTLVAKNGSKVGQRMITRKKGDLTEIAAAWVGDGWVVAWIDERSGDPEVYATKIDPRLNRSSPEQRLTNSAGAAAEPALAFDGTTLRLVWSDARNAELPGHGDIYSVRLRPHDAAKDGDEIRIASTRNHSFAPRIEPFRGGFALAWLERGEEAFSGTVLLATLAGDQSSSKLTPVRVGQGEPRSLALSCAEASCRIALGVERESQSELAAFSWDGEHPGTPEVLFTVNGSGGVGVPPVLSGDRLFYVDGDGDSVLIRRATLKW